MNFLQIFLAISSISIAFAWRDLLVFQSHPTSIVTGKTYSISFRVRNDLKGNKAKPVDRYKVVLIYGPYANQFLITDSKFKLEDGVYTGEFTTNELPEGAKRAKLCIKDVGSQHLMHKITENDIQGCIEENVALAHASAQTIELPNDLIEMIDTHGVFSKIPSQLIPGKAALGVQMSILKDLPAERLKLYLKDPRNPLSSIEIPRQQIRVTNVAKTFSADFEVPQLAPGISKLQICVSDAMAFIPLSALKNKIPLSQEVGEENDDTHSQGSVNSASSFKSIGSSIKSFGKHPGDTFKKLIKNKHKVEEICSEPIYTNMPNVYQQKQDDDAASIQSGGSFKSALGKAGGKFKFLLRKKKPSDTSAGPSGVEDTQDAPGSSTGAAI